MGGLGCDVMTGYNKIILWSLTKDEQNTENFWRSKTLEISFHISTKEEENP